MKLLFHSNAPWAPTGYGAQVALFAPQLAKHHDLAISSFYGLEGSRLNWEGIPVYPGVSPDFGNMYLTDHAKRFFGGDLRAGLVLTLIDVWVLSPGMCAQMNMASWVPVDHEPAPPAVTEFLHNSGSVPIAMSRFGQEMLDLAGLDPLYVPHGVDTTIFKPHPKDEVRELVGVDKDAFLIGIVAANKGRPSRKSFTQSLLAFREFRAKHENAVLYLHTNVDPDWSSGEDLLALVSSLELPEDSVRIADQYRQRYHPMPPRLMAQVYSTFDVLLNPSQGEGFGVPILEAHACGVPAIVTDFSAMKEVCRVGWHVGCDPHWTAQRSWQAIPRTAEIVDALEECYGRSDKVREFMSKHARKHAQLYDARRVTGTHFLPTLAEVRKRIEARSKPPEVKRAVAV